MSAAPSPTAQIAGAFVVAMIGAAAKLGEMLALPGIAFTEAQLEAARANEAAKPEDRLNASRLLAIFAAARELIAAVDAFSKPPEGPRHGV